MEKNFKRLSLALLALGLSMPAFADSSVVVPSQHGGLKVGIDALYLRPTSDDLNYATNVSFPGNFTQGFERNAFVDQNYDWGLYAHIGYLFPMTGNDLTFGYTYLRTDETDSVAANSSVNGNISVLPLGALNNTSFASAAGKAEFDLDAMDLELGQRFTTGAYDMRMFAGLRYADIDHSLYTTAQTTTSTSYGNQKFDSQFKGVGPRIGVEGRYCLNSGFGIDTSLSTGLLVGQVESKYNASYTFGSGTPTTSNFESRNGSENRVVPVLEGKLGLDYTQVMDCRCKSSLMIEAGYQVSNYFNAIDHARVVNTNGSSFAYQNNTSDVGFDGVYLGVKYYA